MEKKKKKMNFMLMLVSFNPYFIFLIVTGSWVVHRESVPRYPPAQDFVKINKLAVTHKAIGHYVSALLKMI